MHSMVGIVYNEYLSTADRASREQRQRIYIYIYIFQQVAKIPLVPPCVRLLAVESVDRAPGKVISRSHGANPFGIEGEGSGVEAKERVSPHKFVSALMVNRRIAHHEEAGK